ncbi:TPA: hypothetical protein N0F65_006049 [Lagenidium giganteum]|uniref:Glycosyltransferase subfamily 4-like N-terminal domain-containing protein n=1 Tax=Lagenidium giganteum TaxID=4803 RepID=A0AAV2YK74_9STRA|nr:TPA: hypothetical protein N0F65_006049 [Lagenidium giganteum]
MRRRPVTKDVGSNKRPKKAAKKHQRHVVVMVLGDVGRSPRMQYHALSLARMDPNVRVSLCGHEGERCVPDIYEQPNIDFLTFKPRMQRISRKLFVLLAPIKVLVQLFQLFWMLLVAAGTVDMILLQNPPTIPTFVVVWICCRLKGAKFVIDWHNLGYSILAMSLGDNHLLVKIARWIERVFGRKADANLCVTEVMQEWLRDTWQIEATVLHDKPPLFFKPTPLEVQHGLLQRVGDQLEHCNDLVSWGENHANVEETLLTRKINGLWKKKETLPRENRPAMIISSTSWTADEDFGILLNALVLLDSRTADMAPSEFPNLLVVVTGKGPQKEMYLQRIKQLAFKRIRIATMWLEASDYPLVLGSADLGVCLHTSSSGLDLPMKVLDMFGCGVPVCAVGFKCLHELVHHDKNGQVFNSYEELAQQLFDLLEGYPRAAKLAKLRAALTKWPPSASIHQQHTDRDSMAAKVGGGFAIGISPEQKLSMGLDELIQKSKKAKPAKQPAAPQGAKKQQSKKMARPVHHVPIKKTIVQPQSKATKARVNAALAANKRQHVVNNRRAGLTVVPKAKSHVTRGAAVVTATRATRAAKQTAAVRNVSNKTKAKPVTASTIDVSNIERHFRSHPKRFDLPKNTNFRITINLDKVKPVVGNYRK